MMNATGEFTVVGETENGELACALAQQLHPRCHLDGCEHAQDERIEATRWIKTTLPQVIIIGLSINLSSEVAKEMRAAGASAYLTKDTAPADLYKAIRSALTT